MAHWCAIPSERNPERNFTHMMLNNAQLALLTLNEAMLRRDQGLITQDQYRAFLYVWHADPTKTESAPAKRRPTGVPDSIVNELLALAKIDEFAKLNSWTEEDRATLVKEQQAEMRQRERLTERTRKDASRD
jgi:hypothetical protein